MIDTKELRRLAQAASHPTTKGRWMRLFGERTVYDRMEDGCRGIPVVSTDKHPPSQFEAACLDFIAAANPAAVSELLNRLEAAEADALEQARLNGMGASREASLLAKLKAAEKERDALRAAMEKIADWYGSWGPYPETNKSWCAMAIVTAREAVKPLINLCAKGE